MDLTERLANERRARLAAERLLENRTRELFTANEKLAEYARDLSAQTLHQRDAARSSTEAAGSLRGYHSRVLNELELAQSTTAIAERRLWDSLDVIRDGFAVFDKDLRLIMSNTTFSSAFGDLPLPAGVRYDELLKSLGERKLVNLAGVPVAAWTEEMVGRLHNEVIPAEILHLSSGSWIRLEERRTRDGDLVCLAIDITEQMRLWAAIEALPDAFVLFDRDEKLLAYNQRHNDLFPGSAQHMVPGTKFETLLRLELQNGDILEAKGREEEWLQNRLRQMRDTNEVIESQLTDGRWILEQEHPTPDGGRVGVRTDITHLREQQSALETARRAAEAASRAKSAFLANMSHEIRTPMNGVVGMAELLCDTPLTDEQRLFAETIRSSGEALLVIINDILDYSKIEAERLTIYPEPFDLERTIHEVTMLLQPHAQSKGIDLMIDYDSLLPTRFIGDPGRLRQVLTNLIGNAVKFTETGHVLTRVVGIDTPEGQQLHVTVEDTGIGIAPEYLGHIFGEFNQVDDEQNRKYEGTGLGLAISQRLIEAMGGMVWVDSELATGSVFGFRLTLPLAEAARPLPPPAGIKKALVVDDNFMNRTIMERQLAPFGIEVTLCRSGPEALAALSNSTIPPDVVLTAHDMSDMDGVTFAGRLRGLGYRMPVVLISATPAMARKRDEISAVDVIMQKPVLRSEIFAQLRNLMPDSPETGAPPSIHSESPSANRLRQMRVLTAEDNQTNQLVFQKMVRGMDIELVFAGNGREAVELWQSFRPDLIFMDISMPEMDGKEASRAIREAEAGADSHVPIIAVTAHAMEGDSKAILASGIDAYLTKPLRRSAIGEALEQHRPPTTRPIQPIDQPAT